MTNTLEIIKSLVAETELLSLRQAALATGYDSRSLRYFISTGRLPYLQIDRDYYVRETDVRKIDRKRKTGKNLPKSENMP